MDMKLNRSAAVAESRMDVEQMAQFIVSVQKTDGEIPWSIGGKTDPWDHVESAMGLSVAGYWREAERAYEWMRKTQHSDGSWYAAYRNNAPEDTTRDTNMSSYIAVGVFHHYLITDDLGFLKRMWSTLRAGVDYAVTDRIFARGEYRYNDYGNKTFGDSTKGDLKQNVINVGVGMKF